MSWFHHLYHACVVVCCSDEHQIGFHTIHLHPHFSQLYRTRIDRIYLLHVFPVVCQNFNIAGNSPSLGVCACFVVFVTACIASHRSHGSETPKPARSAMCKSEERQWIQGTQSICVKREQDGDHGFFSFFL